MNFVEEKKDWEDDIGVEGSYKKSNDSKDSEDCKDCEDEELGDLPPEVLGKIADSFNTEEELRVALDEAGFGDLPVILLNGKPRLVMPSEHHNIFTGSYNRKFALFWAKNRWGASTGASAKRVCTKIFRVLWPRQPPR
jgi:hypothetical protein